MLKQAALSNLSQTISGYQRQQRFILDHSEHAQGEKGGRKACVLPISSESTNRTKHLDSENYTGSISKTAIAKSMSIRSRDT